MIFANPPVLGAKQNQEAGKLLGHTKLSLICSVAYNMSFVHKCHLNGSGIDSSSAGEAAACWYLPASNSSNTSELPQQHRSIWCVESGSGVVSHVSLGKGLTGTSHVISFGPEEARALTDLEPLMTVSPCSRHGHCSTQKPYSQTR